MIIDQNYISWQSLMRWNECRFRNRNKNKNKNEDKDKNRIERMIRHVDNDRFRKALIRNIKIREAENVNKRIETI
jgi:hypothetical protein